MTQQQFSGRRRQLLQALAGGAGVLAVPVATWAASEPVVQYGGGKMVVSGRVVAAADGRALSGAQIEIWQVDARGVRSEASHEVITADGDGRYFAELPCAPGASQRLYYRVSHTGYATKATQLNSAAQQRAVTLMRDPAGVTRAAFEMKLGPRNALATGSTEVISL